MKKNYLLLIILLFVIVYCCKSEEEYEPIIASKVITVDIAAVPFAKLSDYPFFKNEVKNQIPEDGVIPYAPASALFSNYAHKKRFVWLPNNTKASYVADDESLDFPVGSFLIKTFYYDHVLPEDITKLIETRILVRKADSWKAYNYIWNEAQTDAILDTNQQGKLVTINWLENGTPKTVDYKIPSQTDCVTCHKLNLNGTGEKIVPIGPKPQNLNNDFIYTLGKENQLNHWKNAKILENNIPQNIYATVDWEDTSKSLELRARSYIDINCASCHREGGYCDYTPQRFNFSNTNLQTFGVCLTPTNTLYGNYEIQGGTAEKSAMYNRMNTNVASVRMPLIGRNMIHEEGVQLIYDYINSLPKTCN